MPEKWCMDAPFTDLRMESRVFNEFLASGTGSSPAQTAGMTSIVVSGQALMNKSFTNTTAGL
jgi:hypothetical protein